MTWLRGCLSLLRPHKTHTKLQAVFSKYISTLEGTEDRYNGVTVNIKEQIPATTSVPEFQKILKGQDFLFSIIVKHSTER